MTICNMEILIFKFYSLLYKEENIIIKLPSKKSISLNTFSVYAIVSTTIFIYIKINTHKQKTREKCWIRAYLMQACVKFSNAIKLINI